MTVMVMLLFQIKIASIQNYDTIRKALRWVLSLEMTYVSYSYSFKHIDHRLGQILFIFPEQYVTEKMFVSFLREKVNEY